MIVTTLPHVTTYFNPRTPRGVRLADKYTAMSKYTSISIHAPREGCDSFCSVLRPKKPISIHAPREGCDSIPYYVQWPEDISIHAPREGCDSKLYQRAESLLGSICLFAQGEEG